jgi:MFS family permease
MWRCDEKPPGYGSRTESRTHERDDHSPDQPQGDGLAQSFEELVVFRILQGADGGMLTPTGMAMLYRTYQPSEQVRVSRILAVPTGLAAALGPVVGGILVTVASGTGLGTLMYALSEGPYRSWTFPLIVSLGLAGVVLLSGLVWTERRTPQPLVRLRDGQWRRTWPRTTPGCLPPASSR